MTSDPPGGGGPVPPPPSAVGPFVEPVLREHLGSRRTCPGDPREGVDELEVGQRDAVAGAVGLPGGVQPGELLGASARRRETGRAPSGAGARHARRRRDQRRRGGRARGSGRLGSPPARGGDPSVLRGPVSRRDRRDPRLCAGDREGAHEPGNRRASRLLG